MLLAVFTDIHANRQAFGACLDFARARGAERIICLGDVVGYGADPEWTVEKVMDLVEHGAIAVRGNHRLYVHSEASHPAKWRYVQTTSDAARSIAATTARITFCGHIHVPALYSMSAVAKMTSFVPTSGVPVQLLSGRHWLAVLGSVGQPRDGDPAASFAMFDTLSREITYCRVAYDVEAAAKRISDNGLPHWLADRLSAGR